MAKPASKAKLVSEIQTRHKRLEEKIAGIPRDVALKPKTVGAWSVKDTVVHITAWEKTFLTWYNDGLAGKKVDMPDWRIKGTLGAINRKIFEENLSRDLKDILADFTVTFQQILSTVASIQEENIFARGKFDWTGRRTLLDYIWANTAGHYAEHLAAIERMKK
ncbi:MAG: hypothetical protein A2Y58_01715 [Chloroflexi bacterium RBG_13_51_52]|nr:MAG: hypothetical protein A2Y58_01715 [Chloroflexi bacterium RBG_13_51_52]